MQLNPLPSIKIGIADEQQLFLRSLAFLINNFERMTVTMEAVDSKEILQQMKSAAIVPDVLLISVKTPVWNSQATAELIRLNYPAVKTVALSVKDDDHTIIAMLRAGCCAFLLKDIHPKELEHALVRVHEQGYYHSDSINSKLRRLVMRESSERLNLSEREQSFLKLACSDLTYKEIASRMCLSEKTVDGYRESIFLKLNVKSRVGMALEAVKHNLVEL